jgi:hypothetical protein
MRFNSAPAARHLLLRINRNKGRDEAWLSLVWLGRDNWENPVGGGAMVRCLGWQRGGKSAGMARETAEMRALEISAS